MEEDSNQENNGDRLTRRERRELAKEKKRVAKEKELNFSKLKKLIVWLVTILVVGFLGYKVYAYFTTPEPVASIETIAVNDSDWIRGDKNAKAVLIEYGDFECPACKNYFPLVEKLNSDITSDFAFVYRHYPLVQIHQNALSAAKAAQAAGMQGRFWEMYETLYDKQDDWANDKTPEDKFVSYAQEIGIDTEQFSKDFESGEVADAVNVDISSGHALNVNETPTFYLNGKKIQPRSYGEFKKLVEDEIQGYSVQ